MLAAAGPADRIVGAEIKDFVQADRERGGVLISTALAYYDCDLNARLAGERLFVHPNTVLYRLDAIAERTGLDARRAREALDLITAIRVLEAPREHLG